MKGYFMKFLVVSLMLAIIFACSSCSCDCNKKGPEIRNETRAIPSKTKQIKADRSLESNENQHSQSTEVAKPSENSENQDNQSTDCGCGD